jgi:hypothetical protein
MLECDPAFHLEKKLNTERSEKHRGLGTDQIDRAAVAVPAVADRRESSGREIVSQCRGQARWTYNSVVFEVKKEIPDER